MVQRYEMAAIALGGALGSLMRFGLSRWVQGQTQAAYFPWAILTVNIVGCLLMGILFGVLVERFNVGPIWRSGIFIGLLGGFTTFSSFTIDTITLINTGALGTAAIYVLLSVSVCLLATALGLYLVRIL